MLLAKFTTFFSKVDFTDSPFSWTINSIVKAAQNLKGYIAAKKPLLRAINKKKRLQWAIKIGQKRTGKRSYLQMNQNLKYLEISAASICAPSTWGAHEAAVHSSNCEAWREFCE